MKSQVSLLIEVVKEYSSICGTSTRKDINYILRRWEDEGDSFLTITLPTFDKGLLTSLERGFAAPSHWPGFRSRGGLPTFLSGFLRSIFFPDGSIRPTTPIQVDCIRAVRQISLLCSKIFLVADDARVKAAMRSYAEVDSEVPTQLPEDFLREFESTFLENFGSFFQDLENDLFENGLMPAHGPGATANRLSQNEKWSCDVWTDRLENAGAHAYDTLCVSAADYLASDLIHLGEAEEPPVRVIPVPKTMKTPRIIAMEPSWMMYVQQGLFHAMTEVMRRPQHYWIYESICWETQEFNRYLCKDWKRYATIDLSEASDRVPLALVERMLRRFPFVRGLILASRSTKAELPDGTIVPLRKFASMGSAMCFPIETLVFATCALMGGDRKSLSISRYFRNPRRFRVYGDDIIVPIDIVPSVLEVLEECSFKVNTNKSFWNGKFRESCGADWYDGHDVSVVRIRHQLPESRQSGISILKAVDLHNRLFARGLRGSAKYVESLICKLGFPYYAPEGAACFAMWTDDESLVRWRTSKTLQRAEVRCLIPRVTHPKDPLSDYGALRMTIVL